MKKVIAGFSLIMFVFLSIGFMAVSYANDEVGTENTPQQDMNPAGNVPPQGKTWDKAWSGYFGRELPDPLADPNMSPDEWNRQREEAGKRGQAAADFTAAATTVVGAGAPSPTLGVTAAQMAVSEGAGAVVEAETTPTPEKPGLLRRAWNWVKSWFK